MSSKPFRRSIDLLSVCLIVAVTVSIAAQPAAAANSRHFRHTNTNHPRAWVAHRPALPYGPEYGFLRTLPPGAIGGPGYTFVPGVGILGESCDLPTSACTNEYRDVH